MSIVCTLEQKVNFFKAAATTKNLLILKNNTDTNYSNSYKQDNPSSNKCRCKSEEKSKNSMSVTKK